MEFVRNQLLSLSNNTRYINRYVKFLNWCLQRNINREECYTESHHILPASMFPEHKKDKWNIISLTFREHYICHWILAKALGGNMWFAFYSMNMKSKFTSERDYFNSRLYESSKTEFVKQCSIRSKNYWTEEKRIEMSERIKNNNPFLGKHHKDETKQRLSESKKGENNPFYGMKRHEHSEKMKGVLKGIVRSYETKDKIKQSHDVTYTCPHCKQSGGRLLLKHHFDHCFMVNENKPMYKAISPDGTEILFNSIHNLCENHNLSNKTIRRVIKQGYEDECFISPKATVVSDAARNIVGWRFIKVR